MKKWSLFILISRYVLKEIQFMAPSLLAHPPLLDCISCSLMAHPHSCSLGQHIPPQLVEGDVLTSSPRFGHSILTIHCLFKISPWCHSLENSVPGTSSDSTRYMHRHISWLIPCTSSSSRCKENEPSYGHPCIIVWELPLIAGVSSVLCPWKIEVVEGL